MNTQVLDSLYYDFSPLTKTITFENVSIKGDEILMVVNLTKSTVIYNFASKDEGGTFNNNILSLTFDTTAMSTSDKLMVIIREKAKEQILLQKLVDLQTENNELLFKLIENLTIKL